jgi:hypothetical protein
VVKILGGSNKSMIQLWFVMAIPPRGCRVGEGERDQLDGVGLGVPVFHGDGGRPSLHLLDSLLKGS